MSTEHDSLRDLLAPAALGAASPVETRRVEAHAAECAICEEELDTLRSASDLLALCVPQVDPPASLRARLMEATAPPLEATAPAAQAEAREARRSPGLWARLASWRPWPAIAVGMAALALLLVGWNVALQTDDGPPSNADVTAISVRGAGDGAAIRGQALVLRSQGTAVLHLNNMPALPEGRAYQLWALRQGDQPAWVGTVSPSKPGEGVVATADLSDVDQLAITPEDLGNHSLPTTDPWVVVSLPRQG